MAELPYDIHQLAKLELNPCPKTATAQMALDRHTWSTRRGLMLAIFDYIEASYNRHRRHSTLKYYSPEEFETQWQASRQTSEQSVA